MVNTSKLQARGAWLLTAGLLFALITGSCKSGARQASQGSEQGAANRPAESVIEVSPADASAAPDDQCAEMFSNFFVDVDSISYGSYEVVRLQKTIYDKPSGMSIPVSYAELRSAGKTIATFEGVYFGVGNQTAFGFVSLLGGETKQLLVSQTIPRNGRHWIVDLLSNAATLFDSKEWDLGQEDVCVHDCDDDGVQEITLAIRSFCGIGAMSMLECPMIGVVFKYDPVARKYLPDVLGFAHELDGIEEDVEKIDPAEQDPGGLTGPYLARRLGILLRYAYGGRENDGWVFFDRTYNLPDKKETEQRISAALQREPVYRFVYGKRSSGRS